MLDSNTTTRRFEYFYAPLNELILCSLFTAYFWYSYIIINDRLNDLLVYQFSNCLLSWCTEKHTAHLMVSVYRHSCTSAMSGRSTAKSLLIMKKIVFFWNNPTATFLNWHTQVEPKEVVWLIYKFVTNKQVLFNFIWPGSLDPTPS